MQGKYLGRLLRHAGDPLYADKKEGTTKHMDAYMAQAKPFNYMHMGSFAYLGENSAIADFTTVWKNECTSPHDFIERTESHSIDLN
jgi:NADH dehydrogenase FAD-containing subunit